MKKKTKRIDYKPSKPGKLTPQVSYKTSAPPKPPDPVKLASQLRGWRKVGQGLVVRGD